jgi:folate-binding protein YgfZ
MTVHLMNQWHEFLTNQGANFVDGKIASFGNPQAELQAAATGHVLADLSHLGLLKVSGDDAITFLQGQVTNDIKQLNGTNSQFAGYCNPKGRLLALFFAFAHHDHIHLQFNRVLLESISKRLKMYVMRSKVSIQDVSDSIIRLGLAGSNAAALLETIFESVPQQPHELISLENGTLIRLPGTMPRYEIFTDSEHAEAIWATLSKVCVAVGKPVWDYLEINAGIPDIDLSTQESFVPQMINLDTLGAINFKKGCYTGQEIVARTHYLGKVKRRTFLAQISSENSPQAGDVLHDANNQETGQIVRVAANPLGSFDVLAEVRLESMKAGDIHWQGVKLKNKPLPYSIES